MDTRAAIDAILDKAYAARWAHDVNAAEALFAADGCFMANGGPGGPAAGPVERANAMQGLFEALELIEFKQHCRVIDAPHAVVHWRGTFRAKSGKVGEADILDLIEIRDGKIVSLTTFFDTAYAAHLMA